MSFSVGVESSEAQQVDSAIAGTAYLGPYGYEQVVSCKQLVESTLHSRLPHFTKAALQLTQVEWPLHASLDDCNRCGRTAHVRTRVRNPRASPNPVAPHFRH